MSEFGKDFSEKIKSMSTRELIQMIGDTIRDMENLGHGYYVINVSAGEYTELPMIVPNSIQCGSLMKDNVHDFQPTFPVTFIKSLFVREEDHTGQHWSEYNQCWIWL